MMFFCFAEELLGPLTEPLKKLLGVLEIARVERFISDDSKALRGRLLLRRFTTSIRHAR